MFFFYILFQMTRWYHSFFGTEYVTWVGCRLSYFIIVFFLMFALKLLIIPETDTYWALFKHCICFLIVIFNFAFIAYRTTPMQICNGHEKQSSIHLWNWYKSFFSSLLESNPRSFKVSISDSIYSLFFFFFIIICWIFKSYAVWPISIERKKMSTQNMCSFMVDEKKRWNIFIETTTWNMNNSYWSI